MTQTAVPPTRAEYEARVRALAAVAAAMRQAGAEPDEIARRVHAARRALSAEYKSLTPEPLRRRIETRTLAAYGDPLGPSLEHLRASGKSWNAIIESAARPGTLPPGTGEAGPAGGEAR